VGGNAGIGFEIVKSLSQLPNHQILMGCRDTHKGEIAAASMGAPINVNPIQLDVTDDESIELAYLTIAQMFGKLDILIHNAGKLVAKTTPRHEC
jgi:NADP-dependent 3-hydroxy acid dehydrogenase YdfG